MVIVILFIKTCFKTILHRKRNGKQRKFRGISGIPSFSEAICQSFINWHANNSLVVNSTVEEKSGAEGGSHCTMCVQISEGSTMASDNMCPACGKDTTNIQHPNTVLS